MINKRYKFLTDNDISLFSNHLEKMMLCKPCSHPINNICKEKKYFVDFALKQYAEGVSDTSDHSMKDLYLGFRSYLQNSGIVGYNTSDVKFGKQIKAFHWLSKRKSNGCMLYSFNHQKVLDDGVACHLIDSYPDFNSAFQNHTKNE